MSISNARDIKDEVDKNDIDDEDVIKWNQELKTKKKKRKKIGQNLSDQLIPTYDDLLDQFFVKLKNKIAETSAIGKSTSLNNSKISGKEVKASTAIKSNMVSETNKSNVVIAASKSNVVSAITKSTTTEIMDKEKLKSIMINNIPLPTLAKDGTKKIIWTNYQETCTYLSREPQHLQSYIAAETGSETSIDGKNNLVVKGKYTAQKFESLLKNYTRDYIECKTCERYKTTIERDSVTRIQNLCCSFCDTKSAVVPIKSGFKAVAKGERKKARAAGIR